MTLSVRIYNERDGSHKFAMLGFGPTLSHALLAALQNISKEKEVGTNR